MSRSAQRSLPARILFGLLGVVQVTFALAAFLDLAGRREKELRLSKPAWIPIILVNWVGPAAYFLAGVKR